MRISDWSSDVCSSDLDDIVQRLVRIYPRHFRRDHVSLRLANGAKSKLAAEGVKIVTRQMRKEGNVCVMTIERGIVAADVDIFSSLAKLPAVRRTVLSGFPELGLTRVPLGQQRVS